MFKGHSHCEWPFLFIIFYKHQKVGMRNFPIFAVDLKGGTVSSFETIFEDERLI
jgi:hypothetical protein